MPFLSINLQKRYGGVAESNTPLMHSEIMPKSGSVNLYVVNPVVSCRWLSPFSSLDGNVDSLVRLTDVVVQNSTGHGAVLDHFLALFQSVNAEQVDVFANRTACSGDCLAAAPSAMPSLLQKITSILSP